MELKLKNFNNNPLVLNNWRQWTINGSPVYVAMNKNVKVEKPFLIFSEEMKKAWTLDLYQYTFFYKKFDQLLPIEIKDPEEGLRLSKVFLTIFMDKNAEKK